MSYISSREITEDGVSFLFCESEGAEGVWKEVEEMLKSYPELVESYKRLNKRIKGFSAEKLKSPKAMPNTYISFIDICLDENHNNAALDLLESFQNENYYPPKDHIRKMMDFIADLTLDKNICSKSYKVLQHTLHATGSIAFEDMWSFEENNLDDIWPIGYDNFWMFIKSRFNSAMNTKDDQSERMLLFLEQVVNIFEIDMQIKQENFSSSILLRLIPKSVGKLRGNPKVIIDSLLTPFYSEEISMETVRLSQRLFDQIIILSYAGYICNDSLTNEVYLQINKLDSSMMTLFLQTLFSNTFRCQLLNIALLDSDFNELKRKPGMKKLISSPLSLEKIAKLYFYSMPYCLTEPDAIWRHMFFLNSILQSYISTKTLIQGKIVYHGLEEEEVDVITDDLIITRVKELKKWIKKKKMEKDLKTRSELLLDMIDTD
ncbi:14199_t:CDS:2, partial [Funneliformis mosseae]